MTLLPLRKCCGAVACRAARVLLAGMVLTMAGCNRSTPPPAQTVSQPSAVKVDIKPGGPVALLTSTSEFQILPSGYVQASLLKNGSKLTLDEPREDGAPTDSNYLVQNGTQVHFTLDFDQVKVAEAAGKLGRGKRVEVPAHARAAEGTGIQLTLAIEVYDDFPNILLSNAEYKNIGTSDVRIDHVVAQQHRFEAHVANQAPYDMWAYQGSSYDWGKDDVLKVTRHLSQANQLGEVVKGGYGGGIPVVAFWTAAVGEAVGHVETVPLTLALPVRVDPDKRLSAGVDIAAHAILKAGEIYSTPRSFVSVYSGDFYEPLRLWSAVLQKEGWEIPKPSSEAYNVSWCGWGYQADVTPKQMLGTIPKLKELGIKWATLDDRWFNNYGDWNPRSDTFPGQSLEHMVADFHRQGELVQLWWLPLGVEDGEGKWEAHKYGVAKVVQDHPEWLILDHNGKHARMTRNLATLCPAVPEVQAYYKRLTEKFIRDWDFDGSKLDNIYSVPACYNPAHHHRSPQDSVNAMADVYKTIFQTTRALKPQSVTQSCPCGTPPSLAWLPYMDQAVTADPVGAVQVRRRIKMYKALLGPEAAVYGDHVELSEMSRIGKEWSEHGTDFASTVGAGGVVGTKFAWPDPGPKFQNVTLTPAKAAHWKKWIGLYNQKMLSQGTFLDLYVYGYDSPEAYAIAKDGRMYYAFFAPTESATWKGEVELRGLKPGEYRVVEYEDGSDLGSVHAAQNGIAKLQAEFKQHWLLELSPR